MIAAMNALGYAAGALGNHEFNYGLDVLESDARRREFPASELQHSAAGRRASISSPGSCWSATLHRRGGRRADACASA